MLSVLVEVVDDVGDRECCGFLEAPPEAHPPLGESSDEGSDRSSLHSTMMRTSRGSNRSAHAGRGV